MKRLSCHLPDPAVIHLHLDECCGGKGEGYVVEHIVEQEDKVVYFEGTICIQDLPCSLRPPLKLCDIEVCDIRPASNPCAGRQFLQLRLICRVIDCFGCAGEGKTTIEAEIPVRKTCSRKQCTIRRGAQIDVLRQSSCGANAIDVCFKIRIRTVAACDAFIVSKKTECRRCPDIPLYPHPSCSRPLFKRNKG